MQTTELKYDRNFTTGDYKKFFQTDAFIARPDKLGMNCFVVTQGFNLPFEMPTKSHKHDFDQVLCFVGGDPMNIHEFGAEIEIYMGEELEKHVITTNTAIAIPAGMYHCPINVKRVDKPVVFLEFMITGKYEKVFTDNSRSEK